jgi:DNA-binding transcriptional regulator YiaG
MVSDNADPAGWLFKEFREKFNLSQRQAADLFGVSSATWCHWEGTARPQVAARLLVTLLIAKPELLPLLRE